MTEPEVDENAISFSTEETQEHELEGLCVEDEFPISDELVEIEPPAVPLPAVVELSEDAGHLTELICDVCLELNLLTKSAIECPRCGHAFCFHYASSVDAQYCVNCMSDISVTRQVITKTYEHKNDQTGQTTFYRRRAREVKIEGLDWLFMQRKINTLSDVELDLAIEYHRNICSLMLSEQEQRRTVKMHRYAGVQVKAKIPTPLTTKVNEHTHTTVKKTRTVSKTKASEQIASILSALQAQGMSIDQIAAHLSKK